MSCKNLYVTVATYMGCGWRINPPNPTNGCTQDETVIRSEVNFLGDKTYPDGTPFPCWVKRFQRVPNFIFPGSHCQEIESRGLNFNPCQVFLR